MRESLIPQFTIRQLLIIVTACAFFCVILMLAVHGVAAASAVVATVGLLAACISFGALLTAAGLIIHRLRPSTPPRDESPFAQDSLPPSYVVPKDE